MRSHIRIVSAVLVLLLLLSGCAPTGEPSGTAPDESIPTLKVYMAGSGVGSGDLRMINDAISDYVRPLIGANAELIYVSDSYAQTVSQLLASKEQADIVYCGSYNTLADWKKQGFIVPLDGLIDEYGRDMVEATDPEYMWAGRIDGQTCGLPCSRDMAGGVGLEYRADIAEQYGIDMESVKSFDDLTSVFEQVQERCPDITPVASSYTHFWDALGDNYGVLIDYEHSTQVVNLYETPEYEDYMRLIRSWQQSGYVLDRLSNSGNNFYYFRSGDIFSSFAAGKPGFETQETRVLGRKMGFVEIIPPFACTSNATRNYYTISSNSIDEVKSMQLMNLIYSDPTVANLIAYGIEGVHYEFVDRERGIIGFPEGVTHDTSGYSTAEVWRKFNPYITYVWEGDPVDIWDQLREFNHSAVKSTAYGFRFDPAPVQAEILRCDDVRSEYTNGLEYGLLDPDTALPELRSRLKEAGIDTIIAEKQRQLNDWIARGKPLGE